jgi:hypothetical protein
MPATFSSSMCPGAGSVRILSDENGKTAELPLILTLREVVACFRGHGSRRHWQEESPWGMRP